jgi:two-component sensor histidine kinase
VTLSSQGIIKRINLSGADLLGKNRSTLYRSALSSFLAPESVNDYYILLKRAVESENQHSAELELTSGEEQKRMWVRCNVKAALNEGEEVSEWRLTLVDITESKEAQEKLEKVLREKDFLMKEVNHRVKNNLSMISSLINLKDKTLGEEVDLSNVSHQIDAIRIIHSQLYGSENITQVRMDSYIRELLETVFAYLADRRVRVIDNIEDVVFSPRTAVPLGLLINEIATNAMKHGFTDDEEARFSVELYWNPEEEGYVLKVSNSGNPFPESVHVEQPESFGMQLISTLVHQLEGSIELTRKPQPRFTIFFPGEDE